MKNRNLKLLDIKKVILNWAGVRLALQNLPRMLWTLRNNNDKSGRFRIKYGMTFCYNNRGFTLIELLVVVLIIGILAAVAVPQYQKAVDTSRIKAMLPVLQYIRRVEDVYFLENGVYILNFEELNTDLPITSLNKNKDEIVLADGTKYKLSGSGGLPHVFGYPPGEWMIIYGAFNREYWLCYSKGSNRGKQMCKMLGCAADKLNNQYCEFKL